MGIEAPIVREYHLDMSIGTIRSSELDWRYLGDMNRRRLGQNDGGACSTFRACQNDQKALGISVDDVSKVDLLEVHSPHDHCDLHCHRKCRSLHAADPAPCPAANATWVDEFFADEVWPKVAAAQCLKCHKQSGDAEDTRLVLADLSRASEAERAEMMRCNRNTFIRMAMETAEQEPLLLVKVTGGLDHGGQMVLPKDSAGYRVLQEFVQRVTMPRGVPHGDSASGQSEASIFEGVTMLDHRRLLRRATLSLAGRLPTEAEMGVVASQGLEAVPGILDQVMREESFFDRLREAFNDIFLTLGVDGNPDQTVLSYEHFERTRGWIKTMT